MSGGTGIVRVSAADAGNRSARLFLAAGFSSTSWSNPFPCGGIDFDDWGTVADAAGYRLLVPTTGRYRLEWHVGGVPGAGSLATDTFMIQAELDINGIWNQLAWGPRVNWSALGAAGPRGGVSHSVSADLPAGAAITLAADASNMTTPAGGWTWQGGSAGAADPSGSSNASLCWFSITEGS
jgi:hypothetical protein